MRSVKLQSYHRLPPQYQNEGAKLAFFKDGTIHMGGEKFALGDFYASGAFGMIFSRDNYIVKLEISDDSKLLEMDLNHWASESGFGPRFWAWGRLQITRPDFDMLVDQMISSLPNRSRPHWYYDMQDNVGSVIVYYSVFEKWDMDLRQWISQQPQPKDALYTISDTIMKKLATGVAELHKLGMVHLDLLPKNILVNLYNNQVVDIAMTDFGNVIHRDEWFFRQTRQMRARFVKYFLEHKELEEIGNALMREHPAPDAVPYELAYFWLLHEPDNFDWALLTRYNLGPSPIKVQTVPWIQLPPSFNFRLYWDNQGHLDIKLRFSAATHAFGQIYGLWTLSELREAIVKRYPQIKKLHFGWDNGGPLQKVLRAEEPNFRVSTVITQSGDDFYVDFL
jgi:serine/threonine protein kinase